MGRKTDNDDDRGMSDKLFVLKVLDGSRGREESGGGSEQISKVKVEKQKNRKDSKKKV